MQQIFLYININNEDTIFEHIFWNLWPIHISLFWYEFCLHFVSQWSIGRVHIHNLSIKRSGSGNISQEGWMVQESQQYNDTHSSATPNKWSLPLTINRRKCIQTKDKSLYFIALRKWGKWIKKNGISHLFRFCEYNYALQTPSFPL